MKTKEFDFELPEKLIALNPVLPRDSAKLLEVTNKFKLHSFKNLTNILNDGDCIVINDTKVIPAQLNGLFENKKISISLNKNILDTNKVIWSVFVKPQKKIYENGEIIFSKSFYCKIIEIKEFGETIVEFNCSKSNFFKNLNSFGSLALPSYITSRRGFKTKDSQNYQTIFSKNLGAVAAPTASLHFTQKLIHSLKLKNIKIVNVTLHVNGGTFLPIKTKNISHHIMHNEFGVITKNSAKIINQTRNQGRNCIAVGTTVLRLLESSKNKYGKVKEFYGSTDIFIKPGWKVNTVDGLITNFHTPKSTLFVLICALLGIEETKKLYQYAIQNKLRFFSYGDACLIWV